MIEVPRHPCERCGGVLYYHEQRERFCRSCAAAVGVKRMCDRKHQDKRRLK